MLRPPEVAQSMHPEVNELGTIGQPVEYQVAGRPGQYDLAAVRDSAQPGAAVDRLAEIASLVAPLGLRGMQGDAQLYGPTLGMDGALDVQRSRHGIRGAGERRHGA